jgi:hypothetical protein
MACGLVLSPTGCPCVTCRRASGTRCSELGTGSVWGARQRDDYIPPGFYEGPKVVSHHFLHLTHT